MLLTESMDLVPCDRPPSVGGRGRTRTGRAVFFAPKAAGTDDDDAIESENTTPPKSLATRLVFLHPDLEWYDGQQQTLGRRFLQDQHLVRQFRTAPLLAHLGRVLEGTRSEAVKRDALNFAFALFSNDPTKHSKELASVGLQVPTATGTWVKATEAHFGSGWSVDGAVDLALVTAAASNATPELLRVAGRLIARPEAFDVRLGQISKWRDFLSVLGVSAHLPIYNLIDNRELQGAALVSETLAGPTAPEGLAPRSIQQWKLALPSAGNEGNPWAAFVTSDPICWLAGQHEIEELPAKVRSAYARLTVRSLAHLPPNAFSSTWRRKSSTGTATIVPTPLTAFLLNAAWVPVTRPGLSEERQFVPSQEAWFIEPPDHMAVAYSAVVELPLRRALDNVERGSAAWGAFGLQSWGAPKCAASLIDHLSFLFRSGELPDTASDHFRTSLASAWASVGAAPDDATPDLLEGLLVSRAGRTTFLRRDAQERDRIFAGFIIGPVGHISARA